jgi:TatD family-associated radical SAM protein
MEENKNLEQMQANGNGGRKRRRKRKRGGNGNNNAQNPQTQNVQSQQNQQNQQPRPSQQPQQNGSNNAQNGGKKKNKNRDNKQGQGNKNDQNRGGANKQDENRKDTYLYTLDGNLYVNLTNKCSNGCDFCVRNERTSYYGNYLWLRHGDPTAEKVISVANGFGDLTRFKEVVFCGFGEPTYKVAEMVALCDYFHEKGLKTRLNTNGQGNLINKRDIVPDLKGKIDFVNISLNASCVEKYQPICRSQFGEAGFAGLIEFAKLCRRNGVPCRFSIVDCIGEEEVEACKRLAQSVNIPLYIRDYITDS